MRFKIPPLQRKVRISSNCRICKSVWFQHGYCNTIFLLNRGVLSYDKVGEVRADILSQNTSRNHSDIEKEVPIASVNSGACLLKPIDYKSEPVTLIKKLMEEDR